ILNFLSLKIVIGKYEQLIEKILKKSEKRIRLFITNQTFFSIEMLKPNIKCFVKNFEFYFDELNFE
ncbi:hypothetical protein BpHYR1_025554, partial [Brachionus plicatilis]